MPETKAPAPPPPPAPQPGAPQPKALADWTFPRLPQPLDIVEVVGGGGGGPGGGPAPSTAAPQMDGTASAGSAAAYSRGDHRHPSDTSRLATAGGTMTGLLTLNIPPSSANHAATKGYVDSAAGAGGTPSDTNPQMDGTATPGTSTDYSRGDHRHPSDTSRQATLVSGTNIRTVNGQSLLTPMTDLTISGGGGTPSDANPAMDGTAAPGTATTFARGDHVHPSDTSRLALAGGIMTGMITLPATAPVAANAVRKDYVDGTRTMTGFLTLAGAPTTNNMAATKAYVDAVTTALNALTARVVALESAGPPSAPVISSPLTHAGQVGVAFSYTIVAPGATSFNATNLPGGLTRTGAVISGTPTAPVTDHPITISATNAQGTDTKILEVTIAPAGSSGTTSQAGIGPVASMPAAGTEHGQLYLQSNTNWLMVWYGEAGVDAWMQIMAG